MKHVFWLLPGLLLLSLALILNGCAKERARTDIALEMTDEDSVEAIVDQDLLTAGGTIVNIDQEMPAGAGESRVTYVDKVDMQKPVLVEEDDSLLPRGTATGLITEPIIEPGLVRVDEPIITDTTTDTTAGLIREASLESIDIEPGIIDTTEPVTTEVVTETDIPGVTPGEIRPPVTGTEPITSGSEPAVVRPPGGGMYTRVYRTTTPPPVYPRYSVKQGDTLWSISKKYSCTISELCAANSLSRRDILRVGQTLIIPKAQKKDSSEEATAVETGKETVIAKETTEPVKPPAVPTEYYEVKSGDSYWKISRSYGISVAELMALNDTSSDKLRIGQKILVPRK